MRPLGLQWEPVTRVSTQPPPHMYGTPHVPSVAEPPRRHRLPRPPCQPGGHLVSSRGSRGQKAAFCPCSAPKSQGSGRRTETPSVYEEPRQLCLAEHSPAVLMLAPGEHSPPPVTGSPCHIPGDSQAGQLGRKSAPLPRGQQPPGMQTAASLPLKGKEGRHGYFTLRVEGSPWQLADREEPAWLATWG